MSKYIGEIFALAGYTIPSGSHRCDGTELNISSYPDLYNAIGANFGGDDITTFALPDLRSRSIVGAAGSVDYPLTAYPVGSYGGDETAVADTTNIGYSVGGSDATVFTSDETTTLSIRNPFLSINYLIQLV